jgi:hypothetical protein
LCGGLSVEEELGGASLALLEFLVDALRVQVLSARVDPRVVQVEGVLFFLFAVRIVDLAVLETLGIIEIDHILVDLILEPTISGVVEVVVLPLLKLAEGLRRLERRPVDRENDFLLRNIGQSLLLFLLELGFSLLFDLLPFSVLVAEFRLRVRLLPIGQLDRWDVL